MSSFKKCHTLSESTIDLRLAVLRFFNSSGFAVIAILGSQMFEPLELVCCAPGPRLVKEILSYRMCSKQHQQKAPSHERSEYALRWEWIEPQLPVTLN